MEFKKVLFPVDDSDYSRRALEYAIKAVGANGKIIVAASYGVLPSIIGGEAREELKSISQDEANDIVQPYVDKLKAAGISVDVYIDDGEPADVILNACAAKGCDVIVMGSKGVSDLEGLFLGSVAHKVMEYTDVPVLIVK